MAAVALTLPQQAKAQASLTQITLTGTVASGTDSTGSANVFGVGTNLATLDFTLIYTYDPSQGTPGFLDCSGGSPIYYTDIRNSGSAYPGTATLQIGGGTPYPFGGAGESSVTSWALRYAPVCGSVASEAGAGVTTNFSGAFGGGASVGPGAVSPDIYPPSGGPPLSSNPDWSSDVNPAVATDSSVHISFNVGITGAETKTASGDLSPTTFLVTQLGLDINALTDGSGCGCDGPYSGNPVEWMYIQAHEAGQSFGKDYTDLIGDPVNPATGNTFEASTDYTTAGPNVLAFRRYYNGMANQVYIGPPFSGYLVSLATELGSNWRSNYDGYLQIGTSIVSAERPDGMVIPFRLNGSTWTAPAGVDATLTQAGSTWTLTLPNDSVETYSTATTAYGELTSIRLRNGYTMSMTYNSSNQLTTVTDSYSRQLTLSYSSGLLQSVTTPDSTTINYGYTAVTGGNVLSSVSYPTTPATSLTYQYTSPGQPFLLTGIQDAAGNQLATWTYDSQSRAISSKRGGSLGADATTFTYNSDGTVTVTNAFGVADTYTYHKLQGVPRLLKISRAATSTTAAATRSFGYDANGYKTIQTDWNGNTTIYVNNTHGLATSMTEAAGTTIARTTTTVYDPTFVHLPDTITMPELTVGFTYDSNGNPLTKTETDTTTTSIPYSTNGQTRTTQWTWSSTGEMLTEQLPRTDVTAKTTYGYSSDGALTSVTDALSNATTVTTHTGGGRPLTVQDPNSVVTALTYDGGQRVLTSSIATTGGALTTTYTYDTAGKLASVEKPDGSTLSYGYDAANRLTSITDLFGNSINYTLDPLGNKTQTEWEDSGSTVHRSTTATFDALGRMLTNVGGMSQTTTFTYDKNGNTLTIKDPDLNTVTKTYDALNRLKTSVDPSPGGTTTLTYDAHDRPLTVQDPLGHTTSYVFDGFGDRIQVASPDSGTAVYYFDPDSNLTKQVLAGSLEADMTYDADDRLLTTSYPSDGTLNVTNAYDQTGHGYGIGRLTSATDKIGSLSLTYDERGNITYESRVATGITTLNTTYAFDAGNNISSITYPSGTVVAYGRDTMGRVTSVTAQPPGFGSPSNVAVLIAYEPFGPVTGLTYGNGITGTYSYDNDYRTTSRVDAATSSVMNLAYTYDAADNVKTITDSVNAANGQTLTYDALNRLKTAVSGTGGYGSWSWTWDAVHNAKTQVIAGTTTTLNQVSGSNKLLSMTTGSTTTNVTNTSAGNINLLKISGTTVETLTYNQANEMASASASGGSASYAYDLLGRRIEKSPSGGNTIVLQYAGLSPSTLLAEDDRHGNAADYIYLNGVPISEVNPGTGALYYTHTDTLGTPQALTNGSGTAVWNATYKPFGNTQTTAGSVIQHLRLPGQYYDSETGYHANGYRVYDPSSTRYVESDPIGLAGGINTYQYVRANPFKNIDPIGLKELTVSVGDILGPVGVTAYLGYNSGQWSYGGYIGVGTGWSINYDPNDSGCHEAGYQWGWQGNGQLAYYGPNINASVFWGAPGYYSFGQISAGIPGTPLSWSIGEENGNLLPPSPFPTVGIGDSTTFGYGGVHYLPRGQELLP